jgi:phytanoyl-CoA hydroxylase
MLSPEQIEQFQTEGFLVLDPCLESAQVQSLAERVRQIADGDIDVPDGILEYEPGATGRCMENLRKINGPSQHDAFFVDHARQPPLLDAIIDLLGADIKLFGDQLFMKPPGGIEKTYHQDCPYFSIAPMAMITAWVALDDVDEDNGCMYVIPGSHTSGAVDHSEAWMVGDRRDMRIPDATIDRQRERPITLRAGGCSFHHGLLQHRSGANHSNRFRRGLATHYMTSQSRWTGDTAQPAYHLLRGRAYEGCV